MGEVWYETLPDRPGPPLRPASKGRLHSNSFKVRWDCPSDDGGSPITNYILEIDDSRGWQTVYRGSDLECICDNLRPGTQYKVRVAARLLAGFLISPIFATFVQNQSAPGNVLLQDRMGNQKQRLCILNGDGQKRMVDLK